MNSEEELKKYQEIEKRLTMRVKRLRIALEIAQQGCAIYQKEKLRADYILEVINANEIANDLGNKAGELKAMTIKIKEKKEKLTKSKLEVVEN